MMEEKIRCYVLSPSPEIMNGTANELRSNNYNGPVCRIIVKSPVTASDNAATPTLHRQDISTAAPEATETLEKMARHTHTPYILWYKKASALKLAPNALATMLDTAEKTGAAIVYADHYDVKNGTREQHPLIDYTAGSVTDDFDFGSLLLIRTKALNDYLASPHTTTRYRYAGFYDFRLFTSRKNAIVRIGEYLYDEIETDLRLSGQKQFDYVDPRNRKRQIEMERAFTCYLKEIGAYIPPREAKRIDFTKEHFDVEASVIIPVRNRARSIKDAVESALSQKTDFPFNVIVVDNHSDDGTTEILTAMESDKRLVHIIPKRTDLGIGGCWELAAKSRKCGRFAVQLDSDDLYSDEHTLQTIVNKFRRTHAAMVIGSYRMVNFNLEALPPGVIDHREWTSDNGRNNALRINGLGAPRAFYTPLLRKTGVPNTSYGEDYALGLVFSRNYYISRIYDVVYLCRRWEGNSDAALSQEKTNRNNAYKNSLREQEIAQRRKLNHTRQQHAGLAATITFFDKQLSRWPEVSERFAALKGVEVKSLTLDNAAIAAQYNPARIVSTGAKVDKRSISKRPCFLCAKNRPAPQISLPVEGTFEILVNPYPILPHHLVIASRFHEPQSIGEHYGTLTSLAMRLNGFIVFYNGPTSGASAPDHMHFQAGNRNVVPLEKHWQVYSQGMKKLYAVENAPGNEGIFEITSYVCPAVAIMSRSIQESELYFTRLCNVLKQHSTSGTEYPMNVIAWNDNGVLTTIVFLRSKLRPECYFAEAGEQLLVSPGAVDMCGLLITPRKEDFDKLSAEKAAAILREVTISQEEISQIAQELQNQAL